MTSLFFPSISPEAGEPNNEVIPSKEFKYQLKSQNLSGIKNERAVCYTHQFDCQDFCILKFLNWSITLWSVFRLVQ